MDHMEKINRGIRFMEDNLTRPFSLGEVAYEAYTSFYHYHRIFSAVTGMGLREYVRNRRLSQAALDLLRGEPIMRTALKYQFGSQQDFTRAFRRKFFIAPAKYRLHRQELSLLAPLFFDRQLIDSYNNVLNLKPRIITLPERKFIGLSRTGDNNHAENMRLHYSLLERADEIKYRQSSRCSNFGRDVVVNRRRKYCFAVGFPVRSFDALPDGMVPIVFGPGLYARFSYRGTVKFLHDIVFTYIFNVWQRESAYAIVADEFRMSSYRNNFCIPENEEIKIILPVRPKAAPGAR